MSSSTSTSTIDNHEDISSSSSSASVLLLSFELGCLPALCMAFFTIMGLGRKVPTNIAGALQHFAAGILLCTIGTELLPKMVQAKGFHQNLFSGIGFFLGVTVFLLLESFLPEEEDENEDNDNEQKDDDDNELQEGALTKSNRPKSVTVLSFDNNANNSGGILVIPSLKMRRQSLISQARNHSLRCLTIASSPSITQPTLMIPSINNNHNNNNNNNHNDRYYSSMGRRTTSNTSATTTTSTTNTASITEPIETILTTTTNTNTENSPLLLVDMEQVNTGGGNDDDKDNNTNNNTTTTTVPPPPSAKLPWTLLIAIAIDSLMDGLLIGIASAAGPSAGPMMSLSLTVEMSFLGLTLATALHGQPSFTKSILASLLGPTVLVLGAVIGGLVAAKLMHHPALFVGLLSFGTSALLFMVAEELLLEAHENNDDGNDNNNDNHVWWVDLQLYVGFYVSVMLGKAVAVQEE